MWKLFLMWKTIFAHKLKEVEKKFSCGRRNVSIKFEVWQQLAAWPLTTKYLVDVSPRAQSIYISLTILASRFLCQFAFCISCTSPICWPYLWKIKLNCSLNKAKIKSKYCPGKDRGRQRETHLHMQTWHKMCSPATPIFIHLKKKYSIRNSLLRKHKTLQLRETYKLFLKRLFMK